MLHLKSNPIGIDADLQQLQTDVYNSLKSTWVDKLEGYGRIYKDVDSDSGTLKPFWFVDGKDYKEVYYDDNSSGNFFFIDGDNHTSEDGFVFEAAVKCVFMVNLNEILSSETDRADAKAQRDVIHLLRELSIGKFEITGIEKGLSNVFSGLDFSGVHFSDIHPKHCFSVNINLWYYLDQECDILTTQING